MNLLPNNSLEDKQLKVTYWIVAGLTVALFFSAPLVNFFEALLALSVISSKILRDRLVKSFQSYLCLTSLIFFTVIVFSASYSIAPPEETWGMVAGWRKILILPFIYAAIYSKACKELIIRTFLITAICCLIWSYLSYNFPDTFFYTTSAGMIIKNHATQGMFFGIATLICLLKARDYKNIKSLPFHLSSLMFLVNILIVTHGRSGYVVTCACLIGYLIFITKNFTLKKRLAFLTLCMVTIVTLFASAEKSRNRILEGLHEISEPRSSGDPGSMGVRTYWWKHSINMIEKNPILGVGVGGFATALNNEIEGLEGAAGTKTNDPHNQFLKILVEQGIIGFLALLAIILSAFLTRNNSQPYRLIGLTVLVAWCITSLANSHFSTFHEGHFIWFWLGAMLASEK